jgi:chemotaxis protein CheD
MCLCVPWHPLSMLTSDAKTIGLVKAHPGQDLNLLAGHLYFGKQAVRVRTLLGSCVAITLWSPQHHLGGMCHFLLPNRQRQPGMVRDGRYGDEAVNMLLEALTRAGTKPQAYEAHLYGGADTMPESSGVKFNVGERNIEQGWALIDQYGFALQGVDVGDNVPRNVALDCTTGEVTMRRGEPVKRGNL